MKVKVSSLKKLYGIWKHFLDQSGVGQDSDTHAVIVTDDWWDVYIVRVSAIVLNCIRDFIYLIPEPSSETVLECAVIIRLFL